ncbi:hypothetical protein HZA56_04840 [Candidatus Poribacteria bacterium]|nr:hypothetical protein [Candidatus Poribacteria bacterium]
MIGEKWARRISALVIMSGFVYSIYLLGHVQDEVFYSCDGGIKALLVKQYCQKGFGVTLDIEAQEWVKEIWDQGFYPFHPPFVYELDKGYVSSFPIFLAALTAFFYKPFGLYGLYVIPTASLWALWIMFRQVAQRLDLREEIVAISLAVMVFASPLTLYGAMFWEHTLGVLLTFCGAAFLLTYREKKCRGRGLVCGILAALSVCFRSEALVLVAAYAVLSIYLYLRHDFTNARFFLVGMTLGLAGLLLFNTQAYGHPLGVHSLQVLEDYSLLGDFGARLRILQALLTGLFQSFQVLIFILIYMPALYFARRRETTSAHAHIAFICAFFVLGVPFVLPGIGGKQWGPRFLLPLIPLFCLLIGICLRRLLDQPAKCVKYALLSIFVAAFGLGVYRNTIQGSVHLAEDYNLRVKPALDFLRQSDGVCAVVVHQEIAQELAGAFETTPMFLARSDSELESLTNTLSRNGIRKFLLLTYPTDGIAIGPDYSPGARMNVNEFGIVGSYKIFQLELSKGGLSPN